jgi:hypothetical protein
MKEILVDDYDIMIIDNIKLAYCNEVKVITSACTLNVVKLGC